MHSMMCYLRSKPVEQLTVLIMADIIYIRDTVLGKSVVQHRNLWVRDSNLAGGPQPAKLPSFGRYSLETLETQELFILATSVPRM